MNNELIDFLKSIVPIRQLQNNHKHWVSNQCPICKYKSKSYVFMYSSKKKIGKSFCCGESFKDLPRLKMLLTPSFDSCIEEIKNSHPSSRNALRPMNRKKRRLMIKHYNKFKNIRDGKYDSEHIKSLNNLEDQNLPF